MAEVEKNFLVSIWKGTRTFLIAMAVVVLGAIVQGLGSFHPEPGIQTTLWQLFGATLIGGIVSLMNWLKNKNATTIVTETEELKVTTTTKPK